MKNNQTQTEFLISEKEQMLQRETTRWAEHEKILSPLESIVIKILIVNRNCPSTIIMPKVRYDGWSYVQPALLSRNLVNKILETFKNDVAAAKHLQKTLLALLASQNHPLCLCEVNSSSETYKLNKVLKSSSVGGKRYLFVEKKFHYQLLEV